MQTDDVTFLSLTCNPIVCSTCRIIQPLPRSRYFCNGRQSLSEHLAHVTWTSLRNSAMRMLATVRMLLQQYPGIIL